MRSISKTTAVTLSVLSVAVALTLGFSSASNALTAAESDYLAASSASNSQTVSSTTLGDSITQELANSLDAVTAAAGRVDATTSLDATTADAAAAEKALRNLNSALAARDGALKSAKVGASLLPWDYTTATERLHAIDARAVDASSTARAALTKLAGSHASVVAAVAYHTAAVARAAAEAQFAAETAAASKAAAIQKAAAAASQRAVQRSTQAAARAVASVPSFTSPPVSISAMDRALAAAAKQSSPYSVSVRTTFIPSYGADGVWNNGQSAVDGGGQNAIEYSNGWTDVAAHNGNDSIALQLKIGDIVNFSGAISGSYRVTGMIDIPQGSSVSIMGSLGTKMMLQTCDWNSNLMRIVGLVPA